jgi:hypothetical protein
VLRQSAKMWHNVHKLPTKSGGFRFKILDATIDLKSGRIKIDSDTLKATDVAQKCCLAMSISLLYVLCQPRPPGPPSRTPKKVDVNGRLIRRIDSESLTLVVAAGFLIDTPCNSYYVATVNSGSCSACSGTWG